MAGLATPSITQLKSQLKKLNREVGSPAAQANAAEQIAKIKVAMQFHKAFTNACQGIELDPLSAEWYSPRWIVELVRQILGQIDLDPASNAIAQEIVQAGEFYTKEENGLIMPWHGRVFSNPPYGDVYVEFLNRAIELHALGDFHSCIFLVNRSGSKRYRDARNKFAVVCELHDRVKFLNPQGHEESSPRYNNDLLYLGPDSDRFIELCRPHGDCRILQTQEA